MSQGLHFKIKKLKISKFLEKDMILITHPMVYRASTRWSTGRPPVGLPGVHPVDKYGLLGGRKTGPTSDDNNSETVHPNYMKFGVARDLI